MPEEFEVSTDRVGYVVVNPDTHLSVTGQDIEGQPFTIDSIRPIADDPGSKSAHFLYQPTGGEVVSEDVRFRNKIEAAKDVTFEFVQRNKGKIAVIGSIALTVAAGTGLVVRSFRNRPK